MDARKAKIIRRQPGDPMSLFFRLAKKNRPWVVGIYEFEYDPEIPEPTLDELLSGAGVNGYKEENMGCQEYGSYSRNEGNFGAMAATVVNKAGDVKTVIFLRHFHAILPQQRDMINRVTTAHELQHADDFEFGHLKKGQIDLVEAEYRAHKGALKWAVENAEQECVGFYLASLHQHVRIWPDRAEAAAKLIDSPE